MTPAVALVTGLRNDRRRATDPQQKLSKLRVDVFVAAVNEELGVLNDLEDCPTQRQRLRGNLGTVAIVNAVVPTLEEFAVALFRLLLGILDCLASLVACKHVEGAAGDTEDSLFGVGKNDPVGHPVPEESVPFGEKLVEERLNRGQTQHISRSIILRAVMRHR